MRANHFFLRQCLSRASVDCGLFTLVRVRVRVGVRLRARARVRATFRARVRLRARLGWG